MNYIIALILLSSGIIVGILIGCGIVRDEALLIVAPMIMFGSWIMALTYIKRRNSVSGNNHNIE